MQFSDRWKEIKEFFRSPVIVRAQYLIFGVIILVSLFLAFQNEGEKRVLGDVFKRTYVRGSYSVDDGETFVPFDDYKKINYKKANHLIVKGRLSGGLDADETLYMFMDFVSLSVYVNDKIVYASNENEDYYWDALENTPIKNTDELTIDMYTKHKVFYARGFRQFFDNLNKTTKGAIIEYEIKQFKWTILGAALLIIIGFIMLFYGLTPDLYENENGRGLISCGIATVLGGITCFIVPEYITLLFANYELIEYLDIVIELLCVLFLLVYFRRFIVDEVYRYKAKIAMVYGYTIVSIYLLWSSIGYPAGTAPLVFVFSVGVLILVYYLWLFISGFKSITELPDMIALIATCILLLSVSLEIIFFLVTGTYLVHILEFGLIVFALVQFWVIVLEVMHAREEVIKLKDARNELTNAKINIMISQIQPHFLYNAFSTIRALCGKDTEKARDAIDHLAKYLRANMESLNTTECIPITKELEHVKSYLKIEQYRFGSKLNVEYDIEATDFVIPSMTIQTIAENAVKHGLLPKAEGGTLTIKTKETEHCYEVSIIDDGVGYDATPKKKDGRTHVGIENSRKRLAGMCNGTLAIGSKAGQGTTVTICIPKERKEDEE